MIKKILTALGIVLLVVIVQFALYLTKIFEKLELISYDFRARIATDFGPFNRKFKHADKRIVIVQIDDRSAKEISNHPELDLGSWPWRRDVWADVLDYIEQGEPKAVLFDFVFNELNENTWNDRKFAQALRKYDNVVLGTSLNDPKMVIDHLKKGKQPDIVVSRYQPTAEHLDVKNEDNKFDNEVTYYSHAPVHNMYTQHNTMGVVNVVLDVDSVIRRAQPIFKLDKNGEAYYMPSLAFAGFLKYTGDDGQIIVKKNKIKYKGRTIPVKDGVINISWHGWGGDYPKISISRLLLSIKNDKYLKPSDFKDKIVIIGRTEAGTDIKLSSVYPTFAGPELNAVALDNYINDTDLSNPHIRKFVTELPIKIDILIILLSAALITFIGLESKNAILGFFNNFIFMILYVLCCVWLFANPATRLWVPMAIPLYYLIMTTSIVFAYRFQKELARKASVINLFGKLVSPKVLSHLLKNTDDLSLKSTKKRITMLFCDVKDFTSLSEKCDPEQLLSNLNELFDEIVNIIFENNGTVDKFIGDCIMAYWGDPIASPDDAYMAVKTALDIKKKINEMKIFNARENKIIFDVKIGINTGDALLGLAGSERIMSYTVMGDTVNTASRLESACSSMGRDILISNATYEEVKSRIVVLEAGKIKVKGKDEEIEIFEPIGLVESEELEVNGEE